MSDQSLPRSNRIVFKKRKLSFERAHALIKELQSTAPEILQISQASNLQLEPLRLLQNLLIKEIVRIERKIRRSKSMLKALDSDANPKQFSTLEERIAEFRLAAYIWRCFGDAIAFLFLDKFALKQTYFNTENLNPRQVAGFLADKEGIHAEWKIVEQLFCIGIPALLTDLTNTIRHGDVCALVGPDPYLIEVKSGKTDTRGKRQKRAIKKLMGFFETDSATTLRGLGKIRRTEMPKQELTYTKDMNDCISLAEKAGVGIVSPEAGTHYLALSENAPSLSECLANLEVSKPYIFALNDLKSKLQWAPYNPFTLTIEDSDALLRFIEGKLYLAVIIEQSQIQNAAEVAGYEINFPSLSQETAFELIKPDSSENIQVSMQMFQRAAYEFTSPLWILHSAIATLEKYLDGEKLENDNSAGV